MLLRLPPVHFLGLLVGISMIWYFDISHKMIHWPYSGLGIVLMIVGIYLLEAARLEFSRAQTTVMTFDTPQNFVSNGVFSWSRNPMYLGFVLILSGVAIMIGNLAAFIAPVIFFLLAQFWYIPFEEKAAADTFGEAYLIYSKSTRRWF